MRIKLLTARSGVDGSFGAGEILDIDETEAVAYMVKGLAEPVNATGRAALAIALEDAEVSEGAKVSEGVGYAGEAIEIEADGETHEAVIEGAIEPEDFNADDPADPDAAVESSDGADSSEDESHVESDPADPDADGEPTDVPAVDVTSPANWPDV